MCWVEGGVLLSLCCGLLMPLCRKRLQRRCGCVDCRRKSHFWQRESLLCLCRLYRHGHGIEFHTVITNVQCCKDRQHACIGHRCCIMRHCFKHKGHCRGWERHCFGCCRHLHLYCNEQSQLFVVYMCQQRVDRHLLLLPGDMVDCPFKRRSRISCCDIAAESTIGVIRWRPHFRSVMFVSGLLLWRVACIF
jgi:hypothetical protein